MRSQSARTPPNDVDISLPNETLTAILHDLPPPTLANVARVSLRFNAVAERILYSSIFIRDVLADTVPMPWRTMLCCESILQRSHRIESTKRLQIRWQTDPESPPSHYHLNPGCTKLAETLRTLTFLESLDLFLGPAHSVATHPGALHAVERVIHGCQFPHMRYCSLGAEWTKGVQPYTGILDTFLASLPSLLHLKLSDHYSSVNLPPHALPLLSSFRGSTETAACLLPGRPVHSLSLIGQDSDVNKENLTLLTHTSIPMRYIDLSAMSIRPMLLRNIATYLPTVEVLRIRLALRHTLHYALSGIVSTSFLRPTVAKKF